MDFFFCVIVNVGIAILFKLFPKYQIDILHAIVVNYTLSFSLGLLLDPHPILLSPAQVIHEPWFTFNLVLGALFVTGFTLTAYAIQQSGITLTTLMQKMSLIVTVSITVILFHEPFSIIQCAGIGLALFSIYAITKRDKLSLTDRKTNYVVLIFVLLFSAAIETILFYVDHSQVVGDRQYTFTTYGFGCAAVLGWFVVIVRLTKRKIHIRVKDVVAGMVLGVPNFFSILLLLRMLGDGWQAALMYPMLNVAVLLTSALVAFYIFKERLSLVNWIGIGLAIGAIAIIGFEQYRVL